MCSIIITWKNVANIKKILSILIVLVFAQNVCSVQRIWLGDKFIRSDFIVNDGWSQSKVFINMDYCGYFRYF